MVPLSRLLYMCDVKLKKPEHVIGKGNAASMHFNEYVCVLCEFPVNSICPSDSGIFKLRYIGYVQNLLNKSISFFTIQVHHMH